MRGWILSGKDEVLAVVVFISRWETSMERSRHVLHYQERNLKCYNFPMLLFLPLFS